MRRAFLEANVFALTSTLENSPNSLGEAMLLGVPSVAANVGGVRNLMTQGIEGFIYESGDVDTLAEQIMKLFAMEENAAAMGEAARNHARRTHNPEENLLKLIEIYHEIR